MVVDLCKVACAIDCGRAWFSKFWTRGHLPIGDVDWAYEDDTEVEDLPDRTKRYNRGSCAGGTTTLAMELLAVVSRSGLPE